MRRNSARHIARAVMVFTFLGWTPAWSQRSFPPSEKRDGDHFLQRERWFRNGRAVRGQSAAALLRRAHQQKMALRSARAVSEASSPAWRPLGPTDFSSHTFGPDQDYGFVSGRVTSVTIDPTDTTGNTVYVGGAYGGVWKSVNAANPDPTSVTWTSLTDGQPTLATGAIALQPNNSQLILVGTGEPNG